MKGKYKPIPRPARLGFMSYLGDTQGCGTIRVIYPFFYLNHFRKDKLSIHSAYLMNYVSDIMWYQPFTFVQFQRSATEQHLQLINHFKETVQKKFPIPILYEIDDMLFDIPKWNYASLYYNTAEDIIKKIMNSVDAMTVSTTRLKEEYSPYCKNITVIPNHLPKFVWGDVFPAHEYKDEKEKIKILWGGSQNHFSMKDVTKGIVGGDFGKELQNFIRKTTDVYEWHFMGALPEELNDIKSKIKFHPWETVFEYPKALKAIEPDICIAPLVINDFNSCKSNIKCLEYNACGSVAVYSDIAPYKFMSCRSKTDEEMISYIEKLASDIDLRARTYRRDFERVKSQLFWENDNNIEKFINSYLKLFGQCL